MQELSQHVILLQSNFMNATEHLRTQSVHLPYTDSKSPPALINSDKYIGSAEVCKKYMSKIALWEGY